MKKKKIGILTLPLTDNYGGILQATALYNFLECQGYQIFFLNKRFNVSYIKRWVRFLFKINPFYKYFDFNNHGKKYHYLSNINKFIDYELTNSSRSLHTSKDLIKIIKQERLDIIIVGSDQVWRTKYTTTNYADYFLSFIDKNKINLNKIAYAASFGVDEWENKENIPQIKNFLKDFDAISVREFSGKKLCEEIFNIERVEHVLDPTFLVDITYYDKIIQREVNSLSKEVGLFNYVLDKSEYKVRMIKSIAQNLNLKIDSIYLENDYEEFIKNRKIKPSIGEWLYHFKYASYIVTDSFHGMVFCILFNKQFLVIGNEERGLTRFASLLSLLNLSDRLIINDNFKDVLNNYIDYNAVNKKIDLLKDVSKDFIYKNL